MASILLFPSEIRKEGVRLRKGMQAGPLSQLWAQACPHVVFADGCVCWPTSTGRFKTEALVLSLSRGELPLHPQNMLFLLWGWIMASGTRAGSGWNRCGSRREMPS